MRMTRAKTRARVRCIPATVDTTGLDEHTIVIIRRYVRWSMDGLECRIFYQLDPDDYHRIVDAIEDMGGVWDEEARVYRFKVNR